MTTTLYAMQAWDSALKDVRRIELEMLQMQQSSGPGYVTTGQADRNEVRLYEARERASRLEKQYYLLARSTLWNR